MAAGLADGCFLAALEACSPTRACIGSAMRGAPLNSSTVVTHVAEEVGRVLHIACQPPGCADSKATHPWRAMHPSSPREARRLHQPTRLL